MANSGISFFAIIATALVFNSVPAESYLTIYYIPTHTAQQLAGEWHFAAVLNKGSGPTKLPCLSLNMRRINMSDFLNTSVVEKFEGVTKKYEWTIEVQNFYIINNSSWIDPNSNNSKPSRLLFDIYEKLGLLIIYEMTKSQPYTIFTRSSSMDKNYWKLMNDYEITAVDEKLNISYINIDICDKQNETQKNNDKDIITRLPGKWYLFHRLCPKSLNFDRTNSWLSLSVNQTNNDEVEFLIYDVWNLPKYKWRAKVFNSKLYPSHSAQIKPTVYELSFNEKNTELFYRNDEYVECQYVWGRIATESMESDMKYTEIAKQKGWSKESLNWRTELLIVVNKKSDLMKHIL